MADESTTTDSFKKREEASHVKLPFSRGQYALQLVKDYNEQHPVEEDVAPARRLLSSAAEAKEGKKPKAASELSVGIVGGGMAGLYAALLLQDLGIKSTVFEANPTRLGGRVYTYRFDEKAWNESKSGDAAYYNYVDVGAMRIPEIEIMNRLSGKGEFWSLINVLNRYNEDKIKLLPYTYSNQANVKLFNGHRYTLAELKALDTKYAEEHPDEKDPKFLDPFCFGEDKGGDVPREYIKYSDDHYLDLALGKFLDVMNDNFDKGFKNLVQVDALSTRSYLYGCSPGGLDKEQREKIQKWLMAKPLPITVVNWIETMGMSTGHFEYAFTEYVMDFYDFGASQGNWQCVDGGMDRFVTELVKYLEGHSTAAHRGDGQVPSAGSVNGHAGVDAIISKGHEVRSIAPDVATGKMAIAGVYHDTAGILSPFYEPFDHVINTTPLSIMRTTDMSKCNLSFKQQESIRSLHYEFSDKVCLRFKSRFWEKEGHTKDGCNKFPYESILGGQSSTDNPLRMIVYPSYGYGKDEAAVMIASYTWTQDASRMGALCGGSGGSNDHDTNRPRRDRAVQLCLQYLTEIHGDVVIHEYDNQYFVMDWYTEQYQQGAFALFGPGQFSDMYPAMVRPAAGGRLHFAGEAISVHHAWIVGALNSAYRCVWQVLEQEAMGMEKEALISRWGTIDEVDYGHLTRKPDEEVGTKKEPSHLLGKARSVGPTVGVEADKEGHQLTAVEDKKLYFFH